MVAVLAIMALVILASHPWEPSPVAELVVVLPSADGHTGAVVVQREGNRTVLDQPYAANRTGRETGPAQLTEREVRSTFGSTLAAIPARPAFFLLYFIAGTDELIDESKAALARMLDELRRRPSPDILVIGHTDRVGNDADNDQLSLQRAQRVRESLVSQGIAAEHIRAAGRGEREPIVQTADGVDEPRNRRVEINVR
ncbi:MAG TPA: OmpA family protein [Burkholderiales bacterium]|nr:OmpA family protein [Burkholderiales bacterium]